MANWSQLFLDNNFSIPIAQDQFSLLCPFHVDNVQSCSVNLAKGVWICFAGCGQGSLYSFFMKHLGISYDELDSKIRHEEASFNINMFDVFENIEEE